MFCFVFSLGNGGGDDGGDVRMLLADRRIENWMIVLEDGSEEVLERGWG
jgi:hypothetical protein